MLELLGMITLIAVIGSFGVPVLMLALARIGYFPPVFIPVFGTNWEFAPTQATHIEPTVLTYPKPPQTTGTANTAPRSYVCPLKEGFLLMQSPMEAAAMTTVIVFDRPIDLQTGAGG
jgi:hypothetical protein